jgi:hypothetical protein
MANINLYASLADYKAYSVARGQTASTDSTDDGVILDLLETASRFLDTQTRRHYYPTMETRVYDWRPDLLLDLHADLLEVVTLVNGDGNVITSSDYVMRSSNFTPYWAIQLRNSASTYWTQSASLGVEQVISLTAWFGYREHYAQRAWLQVGTLGAAITDTTTLAFTMTAGHSVGVGDILKIGSEIYNVSTVATNTITPIARGDNGSTAATHLISTPVYVWQPQEEAKNATLEIANNAYHRRFGKNAGESATITAAGVVLSARDIPTMAQEFIKSFQRIIL